ncbi:hypothetical protein ACJJTC_008072 [Scirpophaga incertulas]
MYAWEKPFQLVVSAVRAYEMKALKKALTVRSIFLSFIIFTERTTIFITVLTLALFGDMVSATSVYPLIQFINTIQLNLTMILPLAIASISEMTVTLERIQNFLILDEKETSNSDKYTYWKTNTVTFGTKEKQLQSNLTANKYAPIDAADNIQKGKS